MELTSEQKQVVAHDAGHAIVSAVAGSGKTQTMVLRIKYLIDQGVKPDEILVVMYNKSAQLDFQKRLSAVVGAIGHLVQVKTFHGLGYALTRLFVKKNQLKNDQLITQNWQYRKLIQTALETLKKEGKLACDIDSELIDQHENYLTLIKSDTQCQLIENEGADDFNIKLTKKEKLVLKAFFLQYESLRLSEKLRTFDDLIYEPIKLISANPNLKEEIPWRYPYIIIDEYQDINAVQQSLIKLFVNEATEIMVVGDVDQTIYEWRGSKPYYMLRGFVKEFGEVVHYKLSNTFRYGHRLSLAANYIITQNKQRLKNLCISHQITPKTEIEISFNHSIDQLPGVIDQWLKAKPDNSLGDIAVLVRKYSSAALFELACLKHKLPYQILGNEGVTHAQVTLSLIGHLALVSNAAFFDQLNLQERKTYLRAMLLCPSLYLRQTMLETVINQVAQHPKEGAQVLLRLSANYSLKPFQSERIRMRSYLWQELVSSNGQINAAKLLNKIIETLEYDYYFKSKQYGLTEAYDNNCICEAIEQYAQAVQLDATNFLMHFLELKQKASSDEIHTDGVCVLSIHRAKGLEWSNVILLDATESAFFGAGEHYLSEESERRLFYVAITRAKENLRIVGGNDQLKLNQWYQSKRKGFPYDLKATNSVRFLYEMNYHCVCEHLEHITELTSEQKLPKLINRFSPSGKLFKDYIALINQ
ncbi:ATP-dependent helicase [Thiotrichales bacterium 19S3-7]|nr:ATP-dependent helicase [Thiotrichales bacterium 19S3-7]MCF6800752.1 ATP-dependent helicase [Thiotrichales bacterium 19S3-11]